MHNQLLKKLRNVTLESQFTGPLSNPFSGAAWHGQGGHGEAQGCLAGGPVPIPFP